MRAVKSRDTKPERLVQKLAWSIRRGYRLHRKDVLGKRNLEALSEAGWDAIVIWECALKQPDDVVERLQRFLE